MTSDDTLSGSSAVNLIWYPCSENNGLAEAFGVPGFRGHLPFLLDEYDSSTEPEARQLLLGILHGWPLLKKGRAPSVPDDREQNEILAILLDRLMRGFGWNSEAEMARDIAPYILGQFDARTTAAVLEFLMMRGTDPEPFTTWCSLMWDIWRRDRDEDVLNDLFDIVTGLHIESFSGLSRDWLHLIAYALCRMKGKPRSAGEWVSRTPEDGEISSPEIAGQFGKLARLPRVTPDDLASLGSTPADIPDHLVPEARELYENFETFPEFDPARVTTDRSPQRHLLSYTYYPGSPSIKEAFGFDADDLAKFLEDLVNMALDFRHNNPGGDFLRVDAGRRILQNRKDGGGILMSFAWIKIYELVGEKINKALAGTLFEDPTRTPKSE